MPDMLPRGWALPSHNVKLLSSWCDSFGKSSSIKSSYLSEFNRKGQKPLLRSSHCFHDSGLLRRSQNAFRVLLHAEHPERALSGPEFHSQIVLEPTSNPGAYHKKHLLWLCSTPL
ncbi:Hypothetical protein NTJ_10498 [Nesidiocoris tenuis]|uniref:Uncharacterized protein n=1 Tax=Nesidiocoris tenuis TaxID=355587 RepID=A0ABN7B1K7_9HEMI|nr:Hypothetical protein NTJ_10498 [Nesidiocoris tenuis]